MSEITDFYVSWQGCAAFGANNVRLKTLEPEYIRPTDISGCVLWLDANDGSTVLTNDLLQVQSWVNKGTLGGKFDVSGGVLLEYGTTTVNGLNVVTFPENGFMQGNYQFNFQARSVFFVSRENTTPLSVANPWLSSDTTNGMEVFSIRNGSTIYFIGKHPSPVPSLAFDASNIPLQTPVLVEFVVASDISNNWMGLNGDQYPAVYEVAAAGFNTNPDTYYLGGYFSGATVASAQDMCEVIVYNRAVSPAERRDIEEYLKAKWGLPASPPPAPPVPFVPTDISGLQLWLDAANSSSLSLSGSNVSSWSNLGSAGTTFTAGSNTASLYVDKDSFSYVEFPTQTTLEAYFQLPYYSRTAFAVFQNLTSLDTISYPYENLMDTSAYAGRQLGINYDSNTSNYYMAMCQQGINCPSAGPLPSPLAVGGTNLAIWGCDSNTYLSNYCAFNGLSNANTSTDGGNLFNTNPIPFSIGSPVTDSPSFRVAEILEYDSLLSSSNISTVANYLVTKWAISSFTA